MSNPLCPKTERERDEALARVAELEAELRDTKDTIEAVKHSNRSLEAEVEKLRGALQRRSETLKRCVHRAEKAEAEQGRLRDQLREERAELEAEEHAAQLAVDEVRAERDRLAEALENLLSYAENLPHRDLDLWSGWLDFQTNVIAARAALEGTE